MDLIFPVFLPEGRAPGKKAGAVTAPDVSSICNCVSGDRVTNFPEDFTHSGQELHLLLRPSLLPCRQLSVALLPGDGKIPLAQIRIGIRHGFKFPTKQGPVGLSFPVFPWIVAT